MRRKSLVSVGACVAVLTIGLFKLGAAAQQKRADGAAAPTKPMGEATFEKGGEDEYGPYEVAKDWPLPLSKDFTWGRTGGVWAESPDRVFVIQTGEIPVPLPKHPPNSGLWGPGIPTYTAVDFPATRHTNQFFAVDRNGKLLESFEQWHDLWVHPHSVKMNPYDPEKHIWALDGRSESGECAEQVFEFTHDGKKLVMTLGEHKVQGNDKTHFGGPADLAFFPNGDFLVADGYRNSRIVRFDKNGKYLSEFGTKGEAPGQFRTVHAVAIDSKGLIYAADRSNHRVQVFDQSGKVRDVWPNIQMPDDIAITEDADGEHLWVGDGDTSRFCKYDLNGKMRYCFGAFGTQPGRFWGIHRFSTDTEGNLYTAEVYGGRAQKLVPRKGADKTHIIGPFRGFTASR
jgi:sugar lactone lactonase YvrE